MPASKRLKEFLDQNGVDYSVEEHPKAYTAQEVAEVTHVKGQEMIKTIVVIADGKHVMAAVPATRKIDFPALKTVLQANSLRLAEEPEFAADFPECEVGAMPPIGKVYNLRLVAAEPLRQDEEVVFNAGNHREIIRMKRADWERVAQPEWEWFTRPIE